MTERKEKRWTLFMSGLVASQSTLMDALDEEIREFDEVLQSIGDDAQLANIDLQNMLQKQQQTVQMLSNISKVLHDTSMAVIRKISG